MSQDDSWLQNAIQGIKTSSVLLSYLGAYPEEQRGEVLKLTSIYGALALQKQLEEGHPSLFKLRDVVGRTNILACVTDGLPLVISQLEALQSQLLSIKEDLHVPQNLKFDSNTPASVTNSGSESDIGDKDMHSRPTLPALQSPKVPYQQIPSSNLYPDWWGDATRQMPVMEVTKHGASQRPRARSLSPTRQAQQQDLKGSWSPGWGFGEVDALESRPRSAEPAVHADARLPAGSPPWRGQGARVPDPTVHGTPPSKGHKQWGVGGVAGVRSKVQRSIASQRAQVQRREEERQQRVAVAMGMAPAQQAWPAPPPVPPPVPGPADVADQLLANPWTSWLLSAGQPTTADAPSHTGAWTTPQEPAVGPMQNYLANQPPTAAAPAAPSWLHPSASATAPDWMAPPPGHLQFPPPRTAGTSTAAWLSALPASGPGAAQLQAWGGLVAAAGGEVDPSWATPRAPPTHAMAGGSMQVQEAHGRGGHGRAVLESVRPEVARAAKTWVGDFGHLDTPARQARGKPFSHHHKDDTSQQGDKENAGEGSEIFAELTAGTSLNARVQQYMQQYDEMVGDAVQQ